ncbi:MAG: hypothetical protein ACR2GD_13630 [Pyrinomonadaceae bacterium]
MFLIEILSGNLLFGFLPETGALLLCGVSLVGGTIVARRLLDDKKENGGIENDLVEVRKTK